MGSNGRQYPGLSEVAVDHRTSLKSKPFPFLLIHYELIKSKEVYSEHVQVYGIQE